jgi:hypothetical protein
MATQHAPDADSASPTSGAPATPRVSGEVARVNTDAPSELAPESSTRASPPEPAPPGAAPSDTLLSAGKPAERLELRLEDGLSRIEDRLRDLDARLSVLEQKRPSAAAEPRTNPWLWLVFLLALVVIFQLLQRMR